MTNEQLALVKDVLNRAEQKAIKRSTRVYPMHVLAVVLTDDYTTAAHAMKQHGLYSGNVDKALDEVSMELTPPVSGSHFAVSYRTMLGDACRLASDHLDGRSNEVRVYDLVVAALADTDGIVGHFVKSLDSRVKPVDVLKTLRSDKARQPTPTSPFTSPVPIIKPGPTRSKHNNVPGPTWAKPSQLR